MVLLLALAELLVDYIPVVLIPLVVNPYFHYHPQ
jgi:hypothetical protein